MSEMMWSRVGRIHKNQDMLTLLKYKRTTLKMCEPVSDIFFAQDYLTIKEPGTIRVGLYGILLQNLCPKQGETRPYFTIVNSKT